MKTFTLLLENKDTGRAISKTFIMQSYDRDWHIIRLHLNLMLSNEYDRYEGTSLKRVRGKYDKV